MIFRSNNSNNQWIIQLIDQPTNQSIDWSIDQWIIRSIGRATNVLSSCHSSRIVQWSLWIANKIKNIYIEIRRGENMPSVGRPTDVDQSRWTFVNFTFPFRLLQWPDLQPTIIFMSGDQLSNWPRQPVFDRIHSCGSRTHSVVSYSRTQS